MAVRSGYLSAVSESISAKVLYKDDIIRSMQNGGHTWFFDGRPFMAAIHYLINFDTKIFNLAPLNQILGATILCYAGYLFVKKYLSDLSVCLKVLCIVSLVISPLFLENLAFNFESLGFCISLSIPLFLCSVSGFHWCGYYYIFFGIVFRTRKIEIVLCTFLWCFYRHNSLYVIGVKKHINNRVSGLSFTV